MTTSEFKKIFDTQVSRCREVLVDKAKQYATEDRLHNFRVAAELQDCTMAGALAGMMCKHTVSVYDLCRTADAGRKVPMELWDEKITDSINYLILLRAVVQEMAAKPSKPDCCNCKYLNLEPDEDPCKDCFDLAEYVPMPMEEAQDD